jgi:hypothetical protein
MPHERLGLPIRWSNKVPSNVPPIADRWHTESAIGRPLVTCRDVVCKPGLALLGQVNTMLTSGFIVSHDAKHTTFAAIPSRAAS